MKISLSISPDNPPSAAIIVKGNLERGIEMAAALGYDAVEMHIHGLREVDVAGTLALLRAQQLPVSSIGPGLVYGGDTFSFANPDPAIRQEALDRVRLQIDVCRAFHTLAMVGVVHGNLSHDPFVRRQELERIAAHMIEIDHYAGERGVILALEAINRYETNCYNRADELVALIRENRLRSCGILLDNFHMNIEEVSIEAAIQAASQYLCLVHFSDSNRRYPGAGHLDLASIIRALRGIGYDGYLALEALPWPNAETAARRGLDTVRCLLEAR